MAIDIDKLELNVNVLSLQPTFLNHELHYIIASNENTFRFANWSDPVNEGEEMFYCFLTDQELFIPAGNITLKESYMVTEEPKYPVLKDCKDFASIIDNINATNVAKAIRQFTNEDFPDIKDGLDEKYASVKQHLVTSPEAQHQLFVVNNIEISVSATMVYFRQKAPFADSHYQHIKEQS